MNLIDKISAGVCTSIEMIVDKNRQLALLNRLSVIISAETEVINNAYIALGKLYRKKIEGGEESSPEEIAQIIDVIKFSEKRLKKAQARYDYIKVYGVPVKNDNNTEMIRNADEQQACCEEQCCQEEEKAAEDKADITIACAEEPAKTEAAAEAAAETKEEDTAEEE